MDKTCPNCKGTGQIEKALDRPKPMTTDEEMIEKLIHIEFLDSWQLEFVESVSQRVAEGRVLTERQWKKGLQIIEEKG